MLAESMAMPVQPARSRSTAGDRLRGMVESHHCELWRFLKHLGLSETDVDEAIQEVLLVAAEKLDAILPDRERAFLMGTAYRVAKRTRGRYAIRTQRESDQEDFVDEAPLPDVLADQGRARRLAEQVLSSMPLELRSIFVLYEIEELTTAEIAGLIGIPIGTAASRLRRARADFAARVSRIDARARFKERER
jgi:RNA polymerase sigma-70 factor, ECF subfamily